MHLIKSFVKGVAGLAFGPLSVLAIVVIAFYATHVPHNTHNTEAAKPAQRQLSKKFYESYEKGLYMRGPGKIFLIDRGNAIVPAE